MGQPPNVFVQVRHHRPTVPNHCPNQESPGHMAKTALWDTQPVPSPQNPRSERVSHCPPYGVARVGTPGPSHPAASHPPMSSTRYPLAPLEAWVTARHQHHPQHDTPDHLAPRDLIAHTLGLTRTTIDTWHHRGLSDTQADRAAIALGTHPANIWPTWFNHPNPTGTCTCPHPTPLGHICDRCGRWLARRVADTGT